MKRSAAVASFLVCWIAGSAGAQLVPGRQSITTHVGPTFATNRLLKATAIYPTHKISDPFNDVLTDIKLDPGFTIGTRYSYNLTRRLAIEGELDLGVSVFVLRQLELLPDAKGEPKFETTTLDARIFQYYLNLSYYLTSWSRVQPYLIGGVGEHDMNLKQKGEVNPDPIRDRATNLGLGLNFHATERLGIRVEVRDFLYNFSFDNQFVDPVRSRLLVFNRPDFYNTTSKAGPRFQNDLALTLGFQVYPY